MNCEMFPPACLEGTEVVLNEMWETATKEIRDIHPAQENWKIQTLPLARVKKIMKAEEFAKQELEKDSLRKKLAKSNRVNNYNKNINNDEVAAVTSKVKFMIAADAPIVMSRAAELLIRELTVRAWQHTERNRRRTLQRQDIHAAVGESEMYDFLIDIVPRVATAATTTAMPNNVAATPSYHPLPLGQHATWPAVAMAGINNINMRPSSITDGDELRQEQQQQLQQQYLAASMNPQQEQQLSPQSATDTEQQESHSF